MRTLKIWPVTAAVLAMTCAASSPWAATPVSPASTQTYLVVNNSSYLLDNKFGPHAITSGSSSQRAYSTAGADAGSVPFIDFYAATPATNEAFFGSVNLNYHWMLVGNAPDAGPVAVSIRMVGWTGGDLNAFDYGGGVSLMTATPSNGGYQQDEFGFANRTNNTSFASTVSLLVRPNAENQVSMGISYSYHPLQGVLPMPAYQIYGYVDPVITIDPAFESQYTLSFSAIPFAAPSAVPEPVSFALVGPACYCCWAWPAVVDRSG